MVGAPELTKHGKVQSNWSWFCIGGRVTLISHRSALAFFCRRNQPKYSYLDPYGRNYHTPSLMKACMVREAAAHTGGQISSKLFKHLYTYYVYIYIYIYECLWFTATDRKSSQWSQDLRMTYNICTYIVYIYIWWYILYACFLAFLLESNRLMSTGITVFLSSRPWSVCTALA